MSDHENLQRAEAVIAGAKRGDYDQQLGISPDTRDLLTKATSEGPLTAADVRGLTAMNRPDLIAAAYDARRLDLTTPTTQQEN